MIFQRIRKGSERDKSGTKGWNFVRGKDRRGKQSIEI